MDGRHYVQRLVLYGTLLLLIAVASVTGLFMQHQRIVDAAIVHGKCVDTPATPNYLGTRSVADGIAAINNARLQEHMRPLHLPANFYQLDAVHKQFVLVNLERTDRGLRPLRMDASLSYVAQAYSKQLAGLHFFSHTSPISGTFGERTSNDPILAHSYTIAAENLAGNPLPGVGPIYEYMYDDVAEACGHRLTILNPNLSLIGIGEVPDSTYGSMSVQEFLAPTSGWLQSRLAFSKARTPSISIQTWQDQRHIAVNFHALVTPRERAVRITWFVDRIKEPTQIGGDFTLYRHQLPSGSHIIYAYVVDGEGNYKMAKYVLKV
jgi:uncharacterized protein YkwD